MAAILSTIAGMRYPMEQAFSDWLHIMQPIVGGMIIGAGGILLGYVIRDNRKA